MPEKPLVLTSSNRKGGCAKTSSIFHLGAAFSARGLKVLWVDCDPQGSLTQSVMTPQEFERLPDARAVTALFDDRHNPTPDQIIHPTAIEHVSLLPASTGLTDVNHSRPSGQGWLESCLAQFCLEVRERFDLVLIDTPPNLQLLTWAALAASDFVFTPVIPEDYSAQGLVHVRRFVEEVQTARNPRLRWLGLLLTMVQKHSASMSPTSMLSAMPTASWCSTSRCRSRPCSRKRWRPGYRSACTSRATPGPRRLCSCRKRSPRDRGSSCPK